MPLIPSFCLVHTVCVRVSIVIKHQTKSNLVRKEFILPTVPEVRAETQTVQEPGGRN